MKSSIVTFSTFIKLKLICTSSNITGTLLSFPSALDFALKATVTPVLVLSELKASI